MYQIKLENTLTHQEYLFECDDIYNGEKLYYKFNINTKELDEGEYKLTLLNDKGKIEAEDVLKIGNFNPSTLQYRSGENIYISNKINAKIGDKNAVIDSVESVVYPDEEYDAMTSVTINAQGVYDDGYSVGKEEGFDEGYQEGVEIGYQNGFDNGVIEQKKFLTNITITENGTYTRENGYNEITVDVPDLNGDYNEGYQEGLELGYQNGFDNGVIEQKKLLTTISITENGTYNRDNGYNEVVVNVPDTNGSYDEGYNDGIVEGTSNAKEIIVENAQVLDITENGTYTDTDKLIKEVNVNVVPKINMQETGLKLAYSSISEVPEWADWEGITDMSFMFYNCKKINTLPEINTSNVTIMSNVFENCTKLIDGNELLKWDFGNVKTLEKAFNYTQLDKIPSIDTKNVTNFNYAFANFAKYLKEVEPINTSNATTFNYMFYDFSTESVLEKLPEFDCTKVTTINNMFAYSGYQNKLPKLTDCGGWKNLKAKWNDGYGLNHCPNLSYQSCINILNGLYDFTGNGETPTSSQGTLKVHSNFLTSVGDEISIGTNKGWTITT